MDGKRLVSPLSGAPPRPGRCRVRRPFLAAATSLCLMAVAAACGPADQLGDVAAPTRAQPTAVASMSPSPSPSNERAYTAADVRALSTVLQRQKTGRYTLTQLTGTGSGPLQPMGMTTYVAYDLGKNRSETRIVLDMEDGTVSGATGPASHDDPSLLFMVADGRTLMRHAQFPAKIGKSWAAMSSNMLDAELGGPSDLFGLGAVVLPAVDALLSAEAPVVSVRSEPGTRRYRMSVAEYGLIGLLDGSAKRTAIGLGSAGLARVFDGRTSMEIVVDRSGNLILAEVDLIPMIRKLPASSAGKGSTGAPTIPEGVSLLYRVAFSDSGDPVRIDVPPPSQIGTWPK